MIDEKTIFDQPANNDLRKYHNIRKITIGQKDDYTNVFQLDYLNFKKLLG